MPRQTSHAQAPAANDAADGLRTFAAPVLRPHDTARAHLRSLIEGADQRRQDIAEAQARHARAEDVLLEALHDETEAEKILKGVKAQSLMNGADWRNGTGVAAASTALEDARERIDLARGVRDEQKAELQRLQDSGSMEDWHIRAAVSDVVRTHPRLPALIAQAKERRMVFRESEYVLDVIASHFPQGRIPGWNGQGDHALTPAAGDRAGTLRDAIARLHADADTPFPS